jgi:aspartate/methionine/tyrosine aminotransferase
MTKRIQQHRIYDPLVQDRAAFSGPHSALYKHLVNLFGGKPVYLDTYDTGFGIDAARLEKLITPKTRLLLLNSPGNPTGRIFPTAELEAIAKVCAKHGITVISDEIELPPVLWTRG